MGGINTDKSSFGKSNYLGSHGTSAATTNNGILYGNSRTKIRDITDGTSNTILVSERTTKNDGAGTNNCGGTTDCAWDHVTHPRHQPGILESTILMSQTLAVEMPLT